MITSKKVLIWCGDAPNQKALANKVAAKFSLAGIVIDQKKNIRKPSLVKRVANALQDRLFFKVILDAWTGLQQDYAQKFPEWPGVPLIRLDSINSEEAYQFTLQINPDLIIVSGTGIVKAKMLSLQPGLGIINLHTGLSPYIKGGPNCTNWCISTSQYSKIGNTIMWINEGIDSGNIITTECTELHHAHNLREVQWKVMEHAHDLYLRAIAYLLNTPPPHNSIPQKQIGEGKLYLTKAWNFSAKKRMLANLPAFLRKEIVTSQNDIVTVPLKSSN